MARDKETCPTVLLSDEPTQVDAFGHAKVAAAIADMVVNERGGKCIGLTGPWGSGKSSVVELLRKALGANGTTGGISVFVFDAWAHQGDPLRRTFLEQLINHLVELGWLARDPWTKRREELARRIQVTTTTNTPVLRPLGVVLGLTLLAVPFSFQLLLKSIAADSTLQSPSATALGKYLSFVAAGLTLLPIFVALVAWMSWRPNLKPWTKDFWVKHRSPHQDESILTLFLSRSVESIKSNTVRTPDPTSVEFQELFTDAVRNSLSNGSSKLLVVVDNLDRVEQKDARAIWATLRTFFDFDCQKLGTHLDRLWLLVPFDSFGITRLWDGEHGSVEFDEDLKIESSSLTESFLAKTFQVRFRVAPPVLSDWQSFLKSQLTQAFPGHTADDFHRVYRIYDLRGVRGTASPTPRDLKLFVNRIGAIHRQWQDEIVLPVQALYVVLSTQNEGRLGRDLALRTGEEILANIPIDMVGSDWRESIAAIHFNVPKQHALQVLIGNQLTKALLSGDEDNKLEQMAAIPGFYGVLEKQIEDNRSNWLKGETNNLAYSAAALSKLKESEDASWKQTWELIRIAALEVKQWATFGPRTAEGIVAVLQRDLTNDLPEAVLRALSKSLPEPTGSTPLEDSQIDPWLAGLEVIFVAIADKNTELVKNVFVVPGGPLTYIRVMARAAARDGIKKYQHYFRPEASTGDVVGELARIIGEAKFDDTYASAVIAMQGVDANWSWTAFTNAAHDRLQFTGSWPPGELKGLLRTLVICQSDTVGAGAVLRKLTKSGHIFHHLDSANKDVETACLCVIPILQTLPSGNPEQSVGSSPSGVTFFNDLMRSPENKKAHISRLAVMLYNRDRMGLLFDLPKVAPQHKPFVNAILNHMVTKWEKSYRFIDPVDIVERKALFREALTAEEFSKMVEDAIANRSLSAQITTLSFEPSLADLYLCAVRADKKNTSLTAFLTDGLRPLSTDVWLTQLREEGLLLELLFELIDLGIALNLTVAFEDAIATHAEQLASEGLTITRFSQRWADVLRALEKDFEQTALQRMLELLCTAERSTDSLLVPYGSRLAAPEVINFSRDKDRLVLYGFEHMIERLRVAELAWILKVLENNPNLLSEVNPATRRNVEERLATAARQEGLGEEVQNGIRSIAKIAGIDLSKSSESQVAAPGAEPPLST